VADPGHLDAGGDLVLLFSHFQRQATANQTNQRLKLRQESN